MKARVLVVDDDPGLRRALSDRLQHWGHAVTEASDARGALAAERQAAHDLVLLDLALPDGSGLDVLRAMRQDGVGADIVVLTAHGSIASAVEAIRSGADDFLSKPADFDLVRAAVDRTLERRRMKSVNQALAERVERLSGSFLHASPRMAEVAEMAARAAPSNATILLTGESGTGKQVLAEYIHRSSARAGGPFVYVNCVALTDELIESSLFGHEKGAFTGAIARKEGRLEGAAGGTAFLDEVGDISPALQTKLLHFLETGEFERVGGTRSLSVDCRILAATNRDLEAAVAAGRFREDLYYRLNVIRLAVPPLRERPEDIPVLAHAFLEGFAAELKRGPLRLAPETLAILSRYAWPGNVRQLKNAIERMAVLAPAPTLSSDLLPPEITNPGHAPQAAAASDRVVPYKEALRSCRRDLVAAALTRAGGNQTKAAAELGIQRTFLIRLMKEFDIPSF